MHATIADIRRGDIYTTLNGVTWVATDDAEPWATGMTRHFAVRRQYAGLRPDGVYELGCKGTDTTAFPSDQPVLIHDRDIDFHHHINDGSDLPPAGHPDYDRANRECRTRDEVRRVTAIQAERNRQAGEETASYRKAIRDAVEAGISPAELVTLTGLSRARIYQIRDGKR